MIENRENWFRPKRVGLGIQPITLKGWMYTLGWTAAIIVPSIFILKIRKPVFGLIWLSAATAAFTVDVWLILRRLRIRARMKGPSIVNIRGQTLN